jgi:hypothetical protein
MTMEIVSVADLKIGMFVAEPDCPWTEFNFAFQGFVISTPDQVDIFQTKCRFVYIDRALVKRTLCSAEARKRRTTKGFAISERACREVFVRSARGDRRN